jgi:RHS repeat-associated protein
MLCVTTRNQCDGTAARSYSYTSFNMAESVTTGANTTTLGYTPEHARGSLTTSAATLYDFSNPAAGVANELIAGVTPTWRTYLTTEGRIVAEFFSTGGTMTQYYFTGDHLTSTTALTDASGAGKEYDSYDAWGKRRNANGNDLGGCLSTRPSSVTLRGYTGQEEMDSYCLVNLNARLYDPALGRLTSADPTIPDALNGQAFNRYSYVTNNPLSLSDPSGFTPVFGDTVHIICVNSCGANDEDPSESMVDSNYYGAAGSQSLAGIFGGLSGGAATGDGSDFAGMQFAEADTGYATDAAPIAVNETVVVTADRLQLLAQYENANPPGTNSTTVDLRFRDVILGGVDTKHMHGFIVVTNNLTGEKWISQGGPNGPCNCSDPLGSIQSWTERYGPGMSGYGDEANQPLDGSFTTSEPTSDIVGQITTYSAQFNQQQMPYEAWGPNSNTYAGEAWQNLTGSVPQAPQGSGAWGWPGYTGW